MEQSTLDELRTRARASGLRGYSNLRKKQLIELLKKQKASPPAKAVSAVANKPLAAPTAPKKVGKSKSAPPVGAPAPPVTCPPAASAAESVAPMIDVEQHIERAKFETGPRGATRAMLPSLSSNLQEDIDKLPDPTEPVLYLLPQKPGVVHTYWSLQSGATATPLRLRLCYSTGDAIEVLEEVDIRSEHGHWYFYIPTSTDAESFFAQLGHYDDDGHFVSAVRRGVARIPSLYASTRTDRRWWISEQEFRALYQRAGGMTRGERLLWPGSFSSPSK